MRRLPGCHPGRLRLRAVCGPRGKLKEIARALFEPPVTESEAHAEGFELEDYETEFVEVWGDNELALLLLNDIGTRWVYPAMGGSPIGFRWEALYPLMDRRCKTDDEWQDLHEALMVMEPVALDTLREFAPKQKSGK